VQSYAAIRDVNSVWSFAACVRMIRSSECRNRHRQHHQPSRYCAITKYQKADRVSKRSSDVLCRWQWKENSQGLTQVLIITKPTITNFNMIKKNRLVFTIWNQYAYTWKDFSFQVKSTHGSRDGVKNDCTSGSVLEKHSTIRWGFPQFLGHFY
jgi:hypothetical protein